MARLKLRRLVAAFPALAVWRVRLIEQLSLAKICRDVQLFLECGCRSVWHVAIRLGPWVRRLRFPVGEELARRLRFDERLAALIELLKSSRDDGDLHGIAHCVV